MESRVDQKGKYYTDHVTKRGLAVLVYAQGTIVSGMVHLMPDVRLKDELNGG